MRKLTEQDLDNIIGSSVEGYRIEAAKIKQGPFIDSDHYGFLLGRNTTGKYVTWLFYLKNDESVLAHWGHYITDQEESFQDFEARSMGASFFQ